MQPFYLSPLGDLLVSLHVSPVLNPDLTIILQPFFLREITFITTPKVSLEEARGAIVCEVSTFSLFLHRFPPQ